MDFVLSADEARVLGVLIEKDLATPEYYPLSLNALTNGCNQKSSRDPVVDYSPGLVSETLDSLHDKRLAASLSGADHRVPKYLHRLSERFNLTRGELALIAVMLLRGAQTLNELRTRTQSLHGFEDNDAALHALGKLAERESGVWTVEIPRQPGWKETRWTHLLSGEPKFDAALGSTVTAPVVIPREDRLAKLEGEVGRLREEFDAFRKSLE